MLTTDITVDRIAVIVENECVRLLILLGFKEDNNRLFAQSWIAQQRATILPTIKDTLLNGTASEMESYMRRWVGSCGLMHAAHTGMSHIEARRIIDEHYQAIDAQRAALEDVDVYTPA